MIKWIFLMPIVCIFDYIAGLLSREYRCFYIDNSYKNIEEKYSEWKNKRFNK